MGQQYMLEWHFGNRAALRQKIEEWKSMKRLIWLLVLVFAAGSASQPASAQLLSLNLGGSTGTRLIVRDSLGLGGLNLTCLLLGCKVQKGLGDPNGQLFVV